MTRRQARKSLGSRVTRRAGTKTKVIPKSGGKRPPKTRYVHRTKTRVRVLVERKLNPPTAAPSGANRKARRLTEFTAAYREAAARG